MKRKAFMKRKKTKTLPVRISYMNGGIGRGVKAVVHKGEMVLNNPFRKRRKP